MTAPSRTADLITQLADELADQVTEKVLGRLPELASRLTAQVEQQSRPRKTNSAPIAVLTVREAATHARRNERYIRDALHEYVSSRGKHGLRGSQADVNCSWRIRRDDLDAWIDSVAPKRRKP